ncbi:MAG: aminoacetone oxidase family FAD-binding enzyme [Bacteroidales bacterium]
MDIIVIGAGPAGMMAAGTAAENGARVMLLEKMEKPGRKLAITGKGRCNITNLKDWEAFSPHVHPLKRYFKPAFYQFTSEDTVKFFNDIGLPTVLERGTRVYPASQRAFDVIDAMKNWLERLGVQTIYNCSVQEFITEGTREATAAQASDSANTKKEEPMRIKAIDPLKIKAVKVVGADGLVRLMEADHFILATGGKSYPTTGSTGDGYPLASALGHTVEPLFPTLTALMPVNYDRRLEGTQLRNVRLELYTEQVLRRSEEGELYFTNLGIEGPIGFRVSRQAVVALNKNQRVALHLNLKPALTREQLMARWNREEKDDPSCRVGTGPLSLRLKHYMPEAIIASFLKYLAESGLHPVDGMLRWVFPIASYGDWARAVVTAGGISMKEIDLHTMRSKLVANLSFAGEILDLDADSGGYNLQIAFATGRVAGKHSNGV